MLGFGLGASETEAFWKEFLRSLVQRGLKGVQLVTSDAHEGLENGYRPGTYRSQLAALPGALHAERSCPCASWGSGDGGSGAAHDLCPAQPGSGQAAAAGGVRCHAIPLAEGSPSPARS